MEATEPAQATIVPTGSELPPEPPLELEPPPELKS